MSSNKQAKKHLSYDKGVKRFRDARGRFIKASQGLRSKYARQTYLYVTKQATARPKKPRKAPKAEPKQPPAKPLKPVKKLPKYGRTHVTGGDPTQQLITGVGRWASRTLATLLLKEIKRGAKIFRFWYKVVKSGYVYTDTTEKGSPIGSTYPMDVSRMGRTLESINEFLQGGGMGDIKGKVIYFWSSKG